MSDAQLETLRDAIKATCKLRTPLPTHRKKKQFWNCFNCHQYPGTGPADIVDHCKTHPVCKAAILQKGIAQPQHAAQTEGTEGAVQTSAQIRAQTEGTAGAAQTSAQTRVAVRTQGAQKSSRRSRRNRPSEPQPPSAKRTKHDADNSPLPPSSVAPEPSSSVAPEPPSSVAPEPSSSVAPEPPSSAAPEPPSSVAPEQSSSVAPEPPSSVAPEDDPFEFDLYRLILGDSSNGDPARAAEAFADLQQQDEQLQPSEVIGLQQAEKQVDAKTAAVWKHVESHTLKARDESGQTLLLERYQPFVSELLIQVQQAPNTMPVVDEPAHPLNTIHKTLSYHLTELPSDYSLLAVLSQEYSSLKQCVLKGNTVLLTEHTGPLSSSAKVCHEHMMKAAEIDDIRSVGYFMARLGPHENIAQAKLLRALNGADQFVLEPHMQTVDKDLLWSPPADTNPEISLLKWIIYGLALDKAIDRYGTVAKLHEDEPSELERYCLRAALLGKLPRGLATLYDPNVSVSMRASRNEILCSRAPSFHDTVGLPSVHYDQEVHVNGKARTVVDFEIGDAANANSRAATSWSLGVDEAIGKALQCAAAQHNTSRLDLTEGVHIGVGITSLTYTFTPVHYEDMLLGAVNDLLVGAHKVWAFVPPANADLFLQLLEKKYKGACQVVFCKQLRPMLTVAEMQDVGVKFLFQPPGYTVFSLPGRVFHWTISLGFSLAEAANFYTSLSDINLSQLHTDWLAEVGRAERDAVSKKAKTAVKKRADLVTDMVDSLKLYNVL